MKIEDLTKRLRGSGDIEKCCLAAVIETKCRHLKTDPLGAVSKTKSFLEGCLETLIAFGVINGNEQHELEKDIDFLAKGGPE